MELHAGTIPAQHGSHWKHESGLQRPAVPAQIYFGIKKRKEIKIDSNIKYIIFLPLIDFLSNITIILIKIINTINYSASILYRRLF